MPFFVSWARFYSADTAHICHASTELRSNSYMARHSAPKEASDRLLRAIATSLRRGEYRNFLPSAERFGGTVA